MSKKSSLSPIFSMLLPILLLGCGYWWLLASKSDVTAQNSKKLLSNNPITQEEKSDTKALGRKKFLANSLIIQKDKSDLKAQSNKQKLASNPINRENIQENQSVSPSFPKPTSVAPGTNIKIDGSTSMAIINLNLQKGFESKFQGTSVVTTAHGSGHGIKALIDNKVDIAAVSRTLTPEEKAQGLVAVPMGSDAIAVMVGKDNLFIKEGLTSNQVSDIFQGKVNNWSQVGGSDGSILVMNRPPVSGTHQTFKKVALGGNDFGTTPNITTLPRDETTGLVRALSLNGIAYATFPQVQNQSMARVLPIDGLTPEASNYPYKRNLFYVYKNPPSPAVKAFLGYATSPQGKKVALVDK